MNEWVTWGLQGLICFVLLLFWRSLERNSDTLIKIQIDLAKNYVSKTSCFPRMESSDAEINEIRDQVGKFDTQLQLVKQKVSLREGKRS